MNLKHFDQLLLIGLSKGIYRGGRKFILVFIGIITINLLLPTPVFFFLL